MTANELLLSEIDMVGGQLDKLMASISLDHFTTKPIPTMMSAQEILIHLAECYVATLTALKGEEHKWGSYQPEATDYDSVLTAFKSLRGQMRETAVSASEEKDIKNISMFVIGHDNYHVGQLVVIQMAVSSGWDPYSIYDFGG